MIAAVDIGGTKITLAEFTARGDALVMGTGGSVFSWTCMGSNEISPRSSWSGSTSTAAADAQAGGPPEAMDLLISRLDKVRNNAEFLANMNQL